MHSNPLDTEWTREYVVVKLSAYLFYYSIYFVGQFVVLLILDKLNVALSDLFSRLLDSAYKNGVYRAAGEEDRRPRLQELAVFGSGAGKTFGVVRSASSVGRASDEKRASKLRSDRVVTDIDNDIIRRLETYDKALSAIPTSTQSADATATANEGAGALERRVSSLYERLSDKQIRYSEAFYRYMEQGRYYFGCDPIISSARESRLEDFLVYVGSNDKLFSCVFAPKGLRYSKNGRRVVYILQHSLSFLLLAFVDTTFAFITTNIAAVPYIVKYAIPLCIIMPASIMFGAIIKKMYTFSSDLKGVSESRRKLLKLLGRLSIIPFFLIVMMTLILAAILTYSEHKTGIMIEFALKVHVVSVLVELVQARLQYIQSRHVHIYVKAFGGRLSVFKIGAILCELIHKHRHLKGEFVISSRSCCCGVLNIDSIRRLERAAEASSDVEMAGGRESITMQDNPLLAQLDRQRSEKAVFLPPPLPPLQQSPQPAPADDYAFEEAATPCAAAGEDTQEMRARRVLRDATDVRIKRKTLENRRVSFVSAFRSIEDFVEKSVIEAAPRVYEYEYEYEHDAPGESSEADAQRSAACLGLTDVDSSVADSDSDRSGADTCRAVEPSTFELPPVEVSTMDSRTGIRRGSVAELARSFERHVPPP